MKLSHSIGVCSFVLAAVSFSSCASSGKSGGAVDEAEMMKKWTAFMTPGPEHKVLDGKVGSWTTHSKMWMSPSAPPAESEGTSEIDWVMGGRYLHESARGEAMGMPFEGAGVSGYDNLKKKYVGGWIDNWGTGIMMMEGTYDASKKTITSSGMGPDVMAGKYVEMKMVETHVDANHFKLEMYGPDPDGKDFKSMEVAYTRKK